MKAQYHYYNRVLQIVKEREYLLSPKTALYFTEVIQGFDHRGAEYQQPRISTSNIIYGFKFPQNMTHTSHPSVSIPMLSNKNGSKQ